MNKIYPPVPCVISFYTCCQRELMDPSLLVPFRSQTSPLTVDGLAWQHLVVVRAGLLLLFPSSTEEADLVNLHTTVRSVPRSCHNTRTLKADIVSSIAAGPAVGVPALERGQRHLLDQVGRQHDKMIHFILILVYLNSPVQGIPFAIHAHPESALSSPCPP